MGLHAQGHTGLNPTVHYATPPHLSLHIHFLSLFTVLYAALSEQVEMEKDYLTVDKSPVMKDLEEMHMICFTWKSNM